MPLINTVVPSTPDAIELPLRACGEIRTPKSLALEAVACPSTAGKAPPEGYEPSRLPKDDDPKAGAWWGTDV